MKATSRVAASAPQANPTTPKTPMKARHISQPAIVSPLTRSSLVACASLCAITTSAFAASQTWDGETDAAWATATNWVNNAVPGSTAPATNNTGQTDIATFNAASPNTTITTEDTRFINSLAFSGTAASYNITGNLLYLRNGGSISLAPEVTNPQQISANIRVRQNSSTNGAYSFTNNSTTSAATLSITTPTFTLTNANGRPTTLTLGGSNTGENTISSPIINATASQAVNVINKSGTGTWVLSGANTFSGTGATGSANGIQITDGVLAIANSAALGTSGTLNQLQTTVSTTGTLEIRTGLAVDNGVSLNLASGGTIRAVGTTSTLGRINVGTAAATSATISTVGSGDVFTIGDAANDFTGGASDSVVHIAGPGTVILPQASNYIGSVSVDSGILALGSGTSLGALANVNVGSGAMLQLSNGASPSLATLTGAGTVENTSATDATLTTNLASANTFAGSLQNGSGGGLLAFTKTGVGTLNLSGASTYTGATTVNTGSINLTGSLGDTALTLATNTTLSGNGTITGTVTAGSGSHIAPGDGGDASIGTLTTGSLSLDSGSQLDLGITDTTTLDKVNVTTGGGLTINGGQVNINGGSAAFTTNGTYSIINYTGGISGSGIGSLSLNDSNKSAAKTYTFNATGSAVTLTVGNSGVIQTFWNLNNSGNWNTGANWTPATAPNAVGAFAGFGGGGTEITADRTITVNGAITVGTLAFNNASGHSYTLAAGSGALLTLNNGLSSAFITSGAGSHVIDAPLTLTGNGATVTVTNAADSITINGVIDGNGTPLTKGGAGTLVLNGANTYFSGTTINSGTIQINSDLSLGDPANTTAINGGTLRTTTDITSTNTYWLGSAASTLSVASGTTYTIDGPITDGAGAGTLNKVDDGTLVLNNFNSFTGGSVINAGKVRINNTTSLGDSAGAVTIHNATLEATATFTGTRSVVLANANSTLQTETGLTYTIGGPVSGSGTLHKIGAGTISLASNSNSYTGGTVIHAGTLAVNNTSFIMGTLTFQGGTLQNNYGNNNSYFFGNPISIPTGQTGTINMNNRMSLGGGALITGAGTLNVNANTTVARDDFSNNWAGFTGQLNIAGSGTIRLLNNGGSFNAASFANCSVDLGGTVLLEPSNNSGGNTYSFGALSGSSATAGVKGPSQGGSSTLSVGALNTSTTFAGQTLVGHLTKVGTGTLTLTGTTPTGNITVTTGTLSLPTATISDTSTVSVSATNSAVLNLNFDGTDSVDEFIIDGVQQPDGEYGSLESSAANKTARITGNGRLLVLPDDPFPAWIAGYPGVGTATAKTDDPDGDGLTNLDEFAFDGNPADGTATGKVRSRIETVGADQALVITLPVRSGAVFNGTPSKAATIDDVIYTVRGSNNLSAFDQAVSEVTVSSAGMPTLNAGWTYRTFRLDGAVGGATPRGPKGFLQATAGDAP